MAHLRFLVFSRCVSRVTPLCVSLVCLCLVAPCRLCLSCVVFSSPSCLPMRRTYPAFLLRGIWPSFLLRVVGWLRSSYWITTICQHMLSRLSCRVQRCQQLTPRMGCAEKIMYTLFLQIRLSRDIIHVPRSCKGAHEERSLFN